MAYFEPVRNECWIRGWHTYEPVRNECWIRGWHTFQPVRNECWIMGWHIFEPVRKRVLTARMANFWTSIAGWTLPFNSATVLKIKRKSQERIELTPIEYQSNAQPLRHLRYFIFNVRMTFFSFLWKITLNSIFHNNEKQVVQKCVIPVVKGLIWKLFWTFRSRSYCPI